MELTEKQEEELKIWFLGLKDRTQRRLKITKNQLVANQYIYRGDKLKLLKEEKDDKKKAKKLNEINTKELIDRNKLELLIQYLNIHNHK